jgi:hypothetical protein
MLVGRPSSCTLDPDSSKTSRAYEVTCGSHVFHVQRFGHRWSVDARDRDGITPSQFEGTRALARAADRDGRGHTSLKSARAAVEQVVLQSLAGEPAQRSFLALGPNCWAVADTCSVARKRAKQLGGSRVRLADVGCYELPAGSSARVNGYGRVTIFGGQGKPVHVEGPDTVSWS